MLTVALTGGIGSGKSTVARVFARHRVPVLRADDVSKKISRTDPRVRSAVRSLLGPEAYRSDGSLDRRYVASRVFNNAPLLRRLERILHPAVRRYIRRWFAQRSAAGHAAAVVEAALVFESGLDKEVDLVIDVQARVGLRVERIRSRDGASPADIRRRMARQWTDARRRKRADICIRNDRSKRELEHRARFVVRLIQRLARTS